MTPPLDSTDLSAELRQIVAESGGIAPDFNPQAHFSHDLGIPSVKALHLLIALEDRYSISINDQDFVDANSLERLQALMGRLLNRPTVEKAGPVAATPPEKQSGIPGTPGEQQFLQELIRHGHFLPSGVMGIYGRGMVFEDVRNRVDELVSRAASLDKPEMPRFPPVLPARIVEKAGYLKSFPQLCGVVYSFAGNDAEAHDLGERAGRGDDWSRCLSMTDVVLAPAGCYPAYPAVALRGPLPKGGVTLDLGACYVFRNEPSGDPARLQMFHMHEMVRIGEVENVLAWRETWMDRARGIFEQCGLSASLETASDPFFGRGAKIMANNQRQQGLKFEALVPIASPEPTAVASFNFHQDHFGTAFGIQLHDGTVASSACFGFGLERITLALFRAHGMEIRDWPQDVRSRLWPANA